MSLVLIGAVSVEAVKTFTLPESKLLFGDYNDVRIATPDSVQQIRPPFDVGYNRDYLAYPSISPNGDTIAWGFARRFQRDRPEGDPGPRSLYISSTEMENIR